MVATALQRFFQRHRGIGIKAISAANEVDRLQERGGSRNDEINIDVVLPFLFPVDEPAQFEIALLLGACRKLVDAQNQGKHGDTAVIEFVRSRDKPIKLLSTEEYLAVNNRCRRLVFGDIVRSYSVATRRVYYRGVVLSRYLNSVALSYSMVERSVRQLSAFLLFDDDIFDLAEDLVCEKNTILTDFCAKGGDLKWAVKAMTDKLVQNRIQLSGFEVYDEFTEGLIHDYTIVS